jgi:hypothetical protein
MSGDNRRRSCSICNRSVHDLDRMSLAEVLALFQRALADPGLDLCVRVWPADP